MNRWTQLLPDPGLSGIAKLAFEQAIPEARLFLLEVKETLSVETLALLPNLQDIEKIAPDQGFVDRLDGLYFDLEEAGNDADAIHAFSAARFASACRFLCHAKTTNDVMEAVYEAYHAGLSNAR